MMAISADQTARKKTSRASYLLCVVSALSLLFAISAPGISAQGRHLAAVRTMASPPQRRQSSPPPRSNDSAPPNNSTEHNSQAVGPNTAQHAQPRQERQDHLQEWINAHSTLTEDQKEQALRQEPGFSQLPPETQRRYLQRLRELNAMTPEQQQIHTNNIEAMERLSPQLQRQARGALLAIGAMPVERQRLVRKAFRDLRQVPVEQRPAILNSEQFRAQFSDHERGVLRNLLDVEPYLPRPTPSDSTQYGGK